MARYLALVLLRSAVVLFFALTAAYGVASYSPYAFDMIIRPQMFPAVTAFAAWHHVGYLIAFVISVITIVPELRMKTEGLPTAKRSAHWLSLGYVALFGAVAMWLVSAPYLPRLWNDRRSFVVAAASFLPLLWLAMIDQLSAWAPGPAETPEERASDGRWGARQRRLLAASAAAAAFVWAAHLARAIWNGPGAGIAEWSLSAVWSLALVAVLFALVYTALNAVEAATALARSRGDVTRHLLTTILFAAALCEACRRIILPTISLGNAESAVISVAAGLALGGSWSGLSLRRPARHEGAVPPGVDAMLAPACGDAVAMAILVMLPFAAFGAAAAVERFDWGFMLQRLILVCESGAVFGVMLRLFRRARAGEWSHRRALLPAVAALALLFLVPRGALAVARITGDRSLEPAAVFDRYAAGDAMMTLIANNIVDRPGIDHEYFRYLQVQADMSGELSIAVPEVDNVLPAEVTGTRPDIFVFVIDSLRRDYLGSYSPTVTFTPNIDRFADDSFVFLNAYTRYGGTELAIPSIWAGGPVVRRVQQGFSRVNAIEKLIDRHDYQLALSDYTISGWLGDETPVTRLEPGVSSVDPDLCRVTARLAAYLDGPASRQRPVFAYARPMNVHILNWRGRSSLDAGYPGFYAPYASRVKRLDGCFGEFIDHLKNTDRLDKSVIVITGDHGDSLGEEGNWGHAFWLNPEDVRVPLIVHIPDALKPRMTTDLGRIAFTTDIAPTLSALLGDRIRNTGGLWGEPLIVPVGETLSDRRRQPFLLTSSYGPIYGMLRRNGRELFVSDLVERRESLFGVTAHSSARLPVDEDVRRLNQRLIRAAVEQVAGVYEVKPQAVPVASNGGEPPGAR
jgi:hypothetical protein